MDAALSKLLMSFPDPPRTGTCGVSSGGSGPESFVVDSSSGENYTGFVGGDLAVLERACRDEASAADREQLKTLFIERPVLQVERAIEHVQTEIAQQLLSQNTKVRKLFKGTLPSIHLDKRYLDFGVGIGCKCPLTRGLIDEITITNTGHEKVKYKISHFSETPQAVALTITPQAAIIKKKEKQKVSFTLLVTKPVKIHLVLTVDVEGGVRHFCIIKLDSQ